MWDISGCISFLNIIFIIVFIWLVVHVHSHFKKLVRFDGFKPIKKIAFWESVRFGQFVSCKVRSMSLVTIPLSDAHADFYTCEIFKFHSKCVFKVYRCFPARASPISPNRVVMTLLLFSISLNARLRFSYFSIFYFFLV